MSNLQKLSISDRTIQLIDEEIKRARVKHNSSIENRDSVDRIIAILTEEVGEVAEAGMHYEDYRVYGEPYKENLIAKKREHLREELVQVCAVAIRWLEII